MTTVAGIVVPTGGGKSVGRRTLLDIVDELARPVDAADTTVRNLAADAFRSAVRRMNTKGNWPWELLDEDLTITAGQVYSSTVSPIKKPLAMHYLSASGGTRDEGIIYEPYEEFIERWNLNYTAAPHVYTIPNLYETGQIRWFPTPGSNDDVRFTYYRVTPAPRNETEVVEIPDYATDAYVQMAWYEFVKRLPSEQRPFPITIALGMSNAAFREISAHVQDVGDRSRHG
jgi:hypothetical protein